MAQRGRPKKPKTTTPVLSEVQLELMEAYSTKNNETEALYKDLAKIKDLVSSALRQVALMDDCETVAAAAFRAGRAYGPLDEANDKIEEMLTTLYEHEDFNFDHWDDINDN
jgi:hypothetical protein